MGNALNNYESQEEDVYKWNVNTNGNGDAKLIYEEDGGNNIIFIHDRSASGNLLIVKDFITPQTNGTITFYLKMDTVDENIDAGVNFRIFGGNFSENIDFYMNYGNQYYFNDSNDEYNEMYRLNNANEWNLYKINFNCNQNPEYWNVSMNGIQINSSLGNAKFELR